MRGLIRWFVLFLVSSIVSAPLGYWYCKRSTGQSVNIMRQMYALGEYETLTSLEYQQSDATHGKRALLDLLDFMQHLENTQRNALGNSLEVDRCITYMRLALLEEHEGNEEISREYVRQAQDSIRRRSGSEISEAELRQIVSNQDSRPRYALPALLLLRQAKK